MARMWSVTSWVCKCGDHLKVMYQTNGTTIIICPKPPCQNQHTVDGKVSDIWMETDDNIWTAIDPAPFTLPMTN